MKYKMIVMDMDDTLLRDDHTISVENKEAIRKAQEIGVKVVLASGRPSFAMKEIAKDLNTEYMISYNGAVISNLMEDSIIFEKSLSMETAHELYEISKKNDVYIHTYVNDDIITEKNNEYTEIEAKITGMEIKTIEDFKKAVQGNVIKVIMLEEPSYLKKVEEKLKPQILNKLNMVISKPYFLEFTEKNIDKASSIERLINKLGIKQDEVIAIGDSYNDLGMIKYAGLGVCVGNAPDDMKIHADYISKTNMEHGVAHAIEKFIFNN